jgi:hypothetical protein
LGEYATIKLHIQNPTVGESGNRSGRPTNDAEDSTVPFGNLRASSDRRYRRRALRLEISLALATFWLRILSMTKRALFAVAGFLGLCLSLSAQQMQSPEQLLFDGGTLNRPFLQVPSLSLADRDRFFFSTSFGAMQPAADFLPTFSPVGPRNVVSPTLSDRGDSLDNVVEIRASDRIHVDGEVGFLYGKSSGKYGREDFQTYIIGTVGTEKFSITAGYLHQDSSGRVPRWGR